MHVCVVCHEASLTGAPRIGFDIAAHLARSHDVTLLAKKAGPLIDFAQYARLRSAYRVLNTNHEVCDQTYRQRVTFAAHLLGELDADLLYVNSVAAGEWCEAGKRAGIPVVLHTHETRDSLPSLLSSVCTPRVLRFTDLLIGASERALDDIEALTNTRAPRRMGIGIFVDADAVRAGADAPEPPAVNAGESHWPPTPGALSSPCAAWRNIEKGRTFSLRLRSGCHSTISFGSALGHRRRRT